MSCQQNAQEIMHMFVKEVKQFWNKVVQIIQGACHSVDSNKKG